MGAAKGENQEMIKLKDIRKKKKDDKATMNAKIDPKEKDQEVSSDVEESVNEAEMTAAQKKKREEIVLKMKDKEDEFKKNYGDRWKEVMYATATKMAMKEEVIHEAKDQSTDRLKMLVRLGLMDKKDMTKIVRSIGKMKEDKPVSPADRKILFDLLNELIGMVTGDEQMFQKAKKAVREEKDPNEYDKEGEMMKNQLRQICSANEKLMKMVGDDDNLPEWVQNKVTKATDYIRSVRDYLEAVAEGLDLDEISRSMTPMRNRFGPSVDSKKFGVYKDHMKSGKKDATTNNWKKRRPQDRQAAVDSMLGPDHPYNSKNRNKK